MFTKKSFFPIHFIRFIDEEGDNGGGNETEIPDDLGVPYVEPSVGNTDTGEVQNNSGESEASINPAWQKVLDTLPQEFHKQVLPEFQQWDKNFLEVQSKYAPYKPLLENNVSMEDIQSSIELAKWISSDPQAVFEELGRRYGFGTEQGREQVDDSKQKEQEQEYLDLSEQEQNPQLLQLQQTVAGLQDMLNQQEQQKQQQAVIANAQREIESEWSQIESNINSKLGPDIRKEITRRAIIIGDETGNYSLTEGYKDYAEFVNRVRNSRANNSAPSVLPGNGGQPVTKKNLGQMDEEERQDYIANLTRSLVEGQK